MLMLSIQERLKSYQSAVLLHTEIEEESEEMRKWIGSALGRLLALSPPQAAPDEVRNPISVRINASFHKNIN